MSLVHTPLEPDKLSAAAQRAIAPGPARMMAARGLAPLADPRDLVSVLYQLALDRDDAVRTAADASARDLPDNILAGALADTAVDPRVLDFFARRLVGRTELIEVVLLNRALAVDTVVWLAGAAGERETEIIAQNEERLLRHPDIISALYGNRRARMSTVDRVVELAVRNGVKVHGISAWDELSRAILQSGKERGEPERTDEEKDALFAAAARVNAGREGSEDDAEAAATAEEPKKARIQDLSVPMKIRLATLGNKFDRAVLIRDTKKMVALAAIKAPGVTENDAAKYAGNTALVEDVIAYIASRREWVKQYSVKLALVGNPKCPLPVAMRLMTHLREKDVRVIARSKGVSSALAAQARKLLSQRSSRSGK